MRHTGAVLLAALLAGTAASAQLAQPAVPAAVAGCRLIDVHAHSGGTPLLYVACPSSSALLGAAQQYSTASNLANGSVVAVLRNGTATRVLLVSPMADGSAHVDDVSRTLAKQAGGSGGRGLGAAAIDLTRFASAGSVAVGGAASLDLLGLAARAKAVTAAVSSPATIADTTNGG